MTTFETPASAPESVAVLTDFPDLASADGFEPRRAYSAPQVPNSLEEAGLSTAMLESLILKLLYVRGEMVGRELAYSTGLKFSLIEPIIDSLKRQYFIQARAALGVGMISAALSLSDQGRTVARDHMQTNQYTGRAPIPMPLYNEWVLRQRRQDGWLTREQLAHAYRHMVIRPETLSRIGPAVNSGSSFLIYGQPGNGKTYLAEALAELDDDDIYVPYAVECNGAIIQVFDPVYHKLSGEGGEESIFLKDHGTDRRFAKCKRPFVVTGGELTISMLDLSFNETANVYDAPLQMKANNGIYLVDDFGRQIATPAQIFNRWIVPMERRVDFLNLKTGGKITVPFEAFLVFSTNLRPEQLGDEAFLRRIRYKMLVKSPDAGEFIQIFEAHCNKTGIAFERNELKQFVDERYLCAAKSMRRCHPRDLISHAVDLIRFQKRPLELTPEVLDMAFSSCFADETE